MAINVLGGELRQPEADLLISTAIALAIIYFSVISPRFRSVVVIIAIALALGIWLWLQSKDFRSLVSVIESWLGHHY